MSRPSSLNERKKLVVSWWTWDSEHKVSLLVVGYRCCWLAWAAARWCPCLIDVVVVVGRSSSSSSSFPPNRIIGETRRTRIDWVLHKRVKVKRIRQQQQQHNSSTTNNIQTTHYVKESNKDWKDLSTSTTRLTTSSSWEIISSDFYYTFN